MTDTAPATVGGLLFLHAQTSLHPGSGTALGAVDLPVQREKHTEWPLIQGSSLKGVLRDSVRGIQSRATNRRREEVDETDPDILALFGPAAGKVKDDSAHAGALTVTDARILAFPVRSLRGVFAWITCPLALSRLRRDAVIAGASVKTPTVGEVVGKAAMTHAKSPLRQGREMVLEEYDFEADDWGLDEDTIGKFAREAISDEHVAAEFPKRLAVISDDRFKHFVRFATEVTARIGLEYETKTVRNGALFYQEFLPPETLMYSVVLCGDSRTAKDATPKKAADLLRDLAAFLKRRSILQIGGDETTGKGLCAVKLHTTSQSVAKGNTP